MHARLSNPARAARAAEQITGRNRRSAAVAVEAAVVLPILLLVMFSLLDLAIAVLQYNSLAECARRGARAAIVRGEQAIPPSAPLGPDNWSGTADDVHPVAEALRPSLICLPANQVRVSVAWPEGGNRRGHDVEVLVEYDHHSFVTTFVGGPWTLSAKSIMPIVH